MKRLALLVFVIPSLAFAERWSEHQPEDLDRDGYITSDEQRTYKYYFRGGLEDDNFARAQREQEYLRLEKKRVDLLQRQVENEERLERHERGNNCNPLDLGCKANQIDPKPCRLGKLCS